MHRTIFELYHGCDVAADWNASWNASRCYVQGGRSCEPSLDSLVATGTGVWVKCKLREVVEDTFRAKNVTCSPFPSGINIGVQLQPRPFGELISSYSYSRASAGN